MTLPLAVILLAVFSLVAGAFAMGLYFGERGRRKAAERWIVRGSPGEASPAMSYAPSEEAEDRFEAAGTAYTKEMVQRGVEQLKAEAEAEGLEIDEKQLRRDVETMLSGQDVMGDGT